MIKVKTKKEIDLARSASEIASNVLKQLATQLHPGISTKELDDQAAGMLKQLGATPAFRGYHGYPANICTSINDEVVHGIPSTRRLEEGDILSLDVGAKVGGYFGDVACTFSIGNISPAAQRLIDVGRQALSKGISLARAGNHVMDISSAIQTYVEKCGFSIVRKFVGHGIGSQMHEEPEIPNFGRAGEGPILKAGMILAIEPMVNAGSWEVKILPDQWTAKTKDGKLSVHFEHTVCVTEGAPETLTAWE